MWRVTLMWERAIEDSRLGRPAEAKPGRLGVNPNDLSSGAEILPSEAKQNRSRRIRENGPYRTNWATFARCAMPRLQFTISINRLGITPM